MLNIGDNDTEDDDNNNVAVSQDTICSDPYCNYSCHKKDGDLPPPPPPPPPPQRTLTMAKEPHNMQGGRTTRCNLCYIRIKTDYLKNLRHARFMIACCLYAARFILEVEHSLRLCIVFTCSMMFACRGTISH